MTARQRRAAAKRGEELVKRAVITAALGVLVARPADAELLQLAAEMRLLEATLSHGGAGQDEYETTPEGKALAAAISERMERMATIPAVGLAGLAAKAGRICWSLEDVPTICTGERPIVASIAADLVRLAPEAVGGVA